MSLKEILESNLVMSKIERPIPLDNKEFKDLLPLLYDYDKRWIFYKTFRYIVIIDNEVEYSLIKYIVDLNDREFYHELYFLITYKIEYNVIIDILLNLYKTAKSDRGKILVLHMIHSFDPRGTYIWKDGIAKFNSASEWDYEIFKPHSIRNLEKMKDKEKKYNNALMKKYNFLLDEALTTHEDDQKFLVLCEKIVDEPSFYPESMRYKVSQLLERNKEYSYKYHISYAEKYSF